MTAITSTPTTPAPVARSGRTTGSGVTFSRVVTAEWIKLRSLRSTRWTLALTVLGMVGFSLLSAIVMAGEVPQIGAGDSGYNLRDMLLGSVFIGQAVIAVLGVLSITGEYSTGMIRSSLTAVPRRHPVLAAKALVLSCALAVVTIASTALSVLVTLPFLYRIGITVDLADGETLRILFGIPLYLVAIGLFALALGALMRNTAAAITTVLALLIVVENVLRQIPLRFFWVVSPYLPSTAGIRITFDDSTLAGVGQDAAATHLGAWQGYSVLVLWVMVLLTAATVLLRRRDA
jgi:ABC-2 type transport system permease protein